MWEDEVVSVHLVVLALMRQECTIDCLLQFAFLLNLHASIPN